MCLGDHLCENQCTVQSDCDDFYCNELLGYKCRCDGSICQFEEKPKECNSISDCVNSGKCTSDKPCDCVNNYCTKPWWVQYNNENLNCRSGEDCERSILDCQGGKCSCLNKVNVNDWVRKGTCGPKPKRRPRPFPAGINNGLDLSRVNFQ